MTILLRFVLCVIVSFAIFIPSKALSNQQISNQQNKFCNLIKNHYEKFIISNNELKQSFIRNSRKKALKNTFKFLSFKNFKGKIEELTTTSDGGAHLKVKVCESPSTFFLNWNNVFSDSLMEESTIINVDSRLFELLMEMNVDEYVNITGIFFSSYLDHIQESSITISGSMREPEFIVKFNAVSFNYE